MRKCFEVSKGALTSNYIDEDDFPSELDPHEFTSWKYKDVGLTIKKMTPFKFVDLTDIDDRIAENIAKALLDFDGGEYVEGLFLKTGISATKVQLPLRALLRIFHHYQSST